MGKRPTPYVCEGEEVVWEQMTSSSQCTRVCAYSLRSCLSKLRLCLAKFLSSFFSQQVCVNVGQSSGRSSRQVGRRGRLHGICTVTQKDVILVPISWIVTATMSSTCGRLKKPRLSLQYQVMLKKVICSRIMFYVTLWSSFTRIWP